MIPSDHDLMRAAGDPKVLHASWCEVDWNEIRRLKAAREEVHASLVKYVASKVQVIDDAEEALRTQAPKIRVQADIVAMTREEFAECLRKLWAAAALQGSLLSIGVDFGEGVSTTVVGRRDPDGTLHIVHEDQRPLTTAEMPL